MKTIVISLGGSVIIPDDIDSDFLKKFKQLIEEFVKDGNSAVIVCGGGSTARRYVNAVKKIEEISGEESDWIGIEATKINALIVKTLFRDLAYDKVVNNPTEKIDLADSGKKVVVASGWKPGFSTDQDAVLIAKNFDCNEVVNISNIDHVYDKDPKKHSDAKKYDEISWKDYLGLIGEEWKPGMNVPFDPVASKEAEQSNMTVKVINSDIENIKKCINSEEFNGTVISK